MKTKTIDFEKEVFNLRNEKMKKGDWWYWFWLFFFNNPKNPDKPRQLMILWSSKNEKEMECNGVKFRMKDPRNGNVLNGAVASWYFDGEEMHGNFLLEKCNIELAGNTLKTDSETPTSFFTSKNLNRIKIGNDFEFNAEPIARQKSTYEVANFIGGKRYSIIESKRMNLYGKVGGLSIKGSAYFQRVLYSLPFPSWFWSIIHFENGSSLAFFDSYLYGKSIRKKIWFFDGNNSHDFNKAKFDIIGKDRPIFRVSGENAKEIIDFTVKTYSHASWTFKKRYAGIIPNRMTYNEYPSSVSGFNLVNKITGKRITLDDLGKSVGNSEYGKGLLL